MENRMEDEMETIGPFKGVILGYTYIYRGNIGILEKKLEIL